MLSKRCRLWSYRRKPVSSDVAAFYTYQSRWIPGQARNDRQRFTLFLLLEMTSKKLYWTGLIAYINKALTMMKTLLIKSLPTPGRLWRRQRRVNSLYQREGNSPSLAKRGKGRFYNNPYSLSSSFIAYLPGLCFLDQSFAPISFFSSSSFPSSFIRS